MARTTPFGLVKLYAVGALIGAALGGTPLSAWLDASADNRDLPLLHDVASGIGRFGARTGLDRPYRLLHDAIHDAEAASFSASR